MAAAGGAVAAAGGKVEEEAAEEANLFQNSMSKVIKKRVVFRFFGCFWVSPFLLCVFSEPGFPKIVEVEQEFPTPFFVASGV